MTITDRRPTEKNTGPRAGVVLKPMDSMTITKDGTRLSAVKIDGQIVVEAHDVTIEDYELDAKGGAYGIHVKPGVEEFSTAHGRVRNASSAGIYAQSPAHLKRVEIHHCGADAFKDQSGGALAEFCYFHHLGMAVDAHADGVQQRLGSHSRYFRCNINMPAPGTPGYAAYAAAGGGGTFRSNAALIIQTGDGPISYVSVEYCWLNGGGYCVYFTDKGKGPPTHCSLSYNRFGRDYQYKLLETDCSADQLLRVGNVWDDTGQPIADLGAMKK